MPTVFFYSILTKPCQVVKIKYQYYQKSLSEYMKLEFLNCQDDIIPKYLSSHITTNLPGQSKIPWCMNRTI